MTLTEQPTTAEATPPQAPARTTMQVRKRSGDLEPVDVNKIVRAVERWCDDLLLGGPAAGGHPDHQRPLRRRHQRRARPPVDPDRGRADGEEPEYSRLAARLLADYVRKEVTGQGIASFSQSIALGHAEGLIGDATAAFVARHARKLDDAVDPDADRRFEYFGLRTVYDRYLLRHPTTRLVDRDARSTGCCGWPAACPAPPAEAIGFYRLMSSLAYLPSSPTLFNSGTRHTQMSSCYLLDSPRDELDSIYERYAQVAALSKFAGGIGISWSRVRSRGALIRGTNGHSNGIVPWLRTLDASVAAVNQGGRRKGAACVYLEPWHADIEEFLELRDNTGEDARRTHNLNLANWIPDEFMRRVEADEPWSLFDPDEVPGAGRPVGRGVRRRLPGRRGRRAAYVRQVPARELYGRMMRTLAQTGNGWMTFKDAANRTCNQTAEPGNVVHLSNLCTEILEVTSDGETAVCNLGSVNLAAHLLDGGRRHRDRLGAAAGHRPHRGRLPRPGHRHQLLPDRAGRGEQPALAPGRASGVMGLQDVFFALRLPFDCAEARELSTRIAEEIYLTALEASAGLAARARRPPGVRRRPGPRAGSCSPTSGT